MTLLDQLKRLHGLGWKFEWDGKTVSKLDWNKVCSFSNTFTFDGLGKYYAIPDLYDMEALLDKFGYWGFRVIIKTDMELAQNVDKYQYYSIPEPITITSPMPSVYFKPPMTEEKRLTACIQIICDVAEANPDKWKEVLGQ